MRRFALKTTKVLLLEDDEQDSALVSRWLGDEYSVETVGRLATAIPLLFEQPSTYDVIVADLGLPDAKGLAALTRLRDTGTQTPIVALTGLDDEILAVEALELGIQDYIVKDSGSGNQMRRVLRYAIARKKAQSQLTHFALHDPLTGIGNRALFDDRLELALSRALRRNERLAVLYVNLDRFKAVNNAHGYGVADRILQQTAMRLRDTLRGSDSIVRMGADEFTVLLEALNQGEEAHHLLERLVASLATPFAVDDKQVQISASIGIAFYPEDGDDAAGLTKSAETAMRAAKHQGGNRWLLSEEAIAGSQNETSLTIDTGPGC